MGGTVLGASLVPPTGPPVPAPIGAEGSRRCVLSCPTLLDGGCEMTPMLVKAAIGDRLVCAGWPVDTPVVETGLEADRNFPKAARGMLPSALPDMEGAGMVLVGRTGLVYKGDCCGVAGGTELLLSTEERTEAVGAADMEEKILGGMFAGAPPFVSGTLPRGC